MKSCVHIAAAILSFCTSASAFEIDLRTAKIEVPERIENTSQRRAVQELKKHLSMIAPERSEAVCASVPVFVIGKVAPGCGKCVTACPKHLIELVPASATIHVLCANPDKGPQVRKVCGVGCMGCHLCEKNSGGKESGHFTFQGFLAKVNYENPPTDEQIVAKCPAKCMSVDPHFESGR